MASLDLVQDDEKPSDKGDKSVGETASGKLVISPQESALQSHLPQSDSGICLTPQSQASVLSPQQPCTVEERGAEDSKTSETAPAVSVVSPSPSPDRSPTPSKNEDSSGSYLQAENSPKRKGGSSAADQGGPSRSPRRGRRSSVQSPDDFNYQTKYLVLQFLQQMTDEKNMMYMSQNSLSTTSESEARFMTLSKSQRVSEWGRTQSSPLSTKSSSKRVPLKGSASSPDLQEVKNSTKEKRSRGKQFRPLKLSRDSKPPKRDSETPKRASQSPKQEASDVGLIRSISENTENSETATYNSDADDELDTSFDSSLHGSTTSHTFRNKVVQFSDQTFQGCMPTTQAQTESITEVPHSVAEESEYHEPALPVLDLNLNNVEQHIVSPVTQYARVNDYLSQMNESHILLSQTNYTSAADVTDTTLQNLDDFDDVDSPPFNQLSHPDQAILEAGGLHPAAPTEDGAMSTGFDFPNTAEVLSEELQGAWGGVDEDDVDRSGRQLRHGQIADRSRLRLDLRDQDASLVDAFQILQEEINEEISSLESELEEVLHAANSDPASSGGLSRPISPNTAEIAHKLALIGDQVQHEYFDHLDRAVSRLFLENYTGLLTYENFREAAMLALDKDLHGWKQVATVLLYSRHVALYLARSGRRTLHRIIDFTVRLLADTAADFIIQKGGWGSIASMDLGSSSSDEMDPVFNPFPSSVSLTSTCTMTTTTSTVQNPLLSNNMTSDLQGISTTPHGMVSDSIDHIDARESLQRIESEGEAIAVNAQPGTGDPSAVSSPSQRKEKSEQDEEGKPVANEDESDGVMPSAGDTTVNSNVLVGCALSAGVIAAGASLAFMLACR